MKWPGYWIVVVAIGHGIVSAFFFGRTYVELARVGFWGSVSSSVEQLALWFGIASPFMLLVGLCVLGSPKNSTVIGVTLGLTALLGAILLPISGFWMLIPPAVGISLNSKRSA